MNASPSPRKAPSSRRDAAFSPGDAASRRDAASRDLAVARWLLGDAGRAALASLPPYRSDDAFALTARLRREGLDADQTAAALTLSRLRTRAAAKFGERADSMFFTVDGYEQATRLSVGALHAARFVEAGTRRVIDFGCGVGADSLAFTLAGLEVTAIEADPVTALYAAANAPEAKVICADGLATELPEADAIWLDPARRAEDGRRIASPERWTPPFSRALSLARRFPLAGIKAAPGIAYHALPPNAFVEWISERGQLLEAVVWLGMGTGRTATVDGERFDSGAKTADEPAVFVAPRALGPLLLEPDPAIVRSGGIARLCEKHGLAPVSEGIAYLTGEAAAPHCAAFEVLDVVAPEAKQVRRALAAHGIGPAEVKKRGTELDVAAMAKRLSGRRGDPGVVLFSPVLGRHRAIVARRKGALTF